MKLAGLILAAGRSSRMGRDKALLPYGNATFLSSLVEVLRSRLDPVIVVLGHHAEEIRPAAAGARVVVNEGYDRGMLSSLQTGLRAMPEGTEAVAFTLVDHPGVSSSTLAQLIEAFETSGAPVAIPLYRGERGHPVIVSRGVMAELLALPSEGSPKEILRARYSEAVFVEVEDPAVVADIDRPEDLERLMRH
jgi:molybdenum cofactor cytidylyltransferase